LSGADLTAAQLSGADLTGANVAGAIFTQSNVNSARLIDLVGEADAVDLENAHYFNRAWRN
jgi:uncharacterized protein YjbI with pentapeptide repeats